MQVDVWNNYNFVNFWISMFGTIQNRKCTFLNKFVAHALHSFWLDIGQLLSLGDHEHHTGLHCSAEVEEQV